MTLSRLNLVCSICSALGGVVMALFADALTGMIWMAASLIWLGMALRSRRATECEAHPVQCIGHRLSRLLLWS